jgi:hypothetical protein
MGAASTVATLQKNLDLMIRSGSPVDCSKAYGGKQEILKGEHTWTTGLRVSSAQRVWGQGPATRITYLGGPNDPPAFEIFSYNGNGYVDVPTISDVQIHCPNGGRAIGIHSSVKVLEGCHINVITNGGIRLDCEQYHSVISGRIYTRGQQALKLRGNYASANTLRGLKVNGFAVDCVANVEICGGWTLESSCWFEDIHQDNMPANAAPMFYFGPNEAGHRGNVSVSGLFHDEAHKDRTWAVVENSDFHAVNIGGTENWPWIVNKGGAIHTQRPPHNAQTVRTTDGTGKLYVSGKLVEPVS